MRQRQISPAYPGLAAVATWATTVGFDRVVARWALSRWASSARARAGAGQKPASAVRVAALLPAHNEAGAISAAVASISTQVDRVIVVADNCDDDTAALAAQAGAEVFTTVGNTAKKAGALNQALAWLLPDWEGPVIVMDADSNISADFVATALRYLKADPRLGAVGGVFFGAEPHGLLELAQANEYRRYSRTIAQKRGAVQVLTGTASIFRRDALDDLLSWRDFVYDPEARTEDNEITLALKSRGWNLLSPQACRVGTELMGTWKELRVQRTRWYRGALDNLISYGWTPVTRRYWGQQAGLAAATIATFAYLSWTVFLAVHGWLELSPVWTLIGVGFVLERVVTVWSGGWKARLLAALLLPEMLYDIFLQTVFLRAVFTLVARRDVVWRTPSVETREVSACIAP